MAVITNYATLQTEIANTLSRDDLTAEIPQFIQFAENKLSRTLNLRNEETALSVNISSGVAAVPTDFKALKFAYYDAAPTQLLQWVTIEELFRDYPNRSDSSIPKLISRQGSNFVFGPVSSDKTAGLKGIYYAKQDPLRTTDPSWYVTNAPEVLLYASLVEATPFIHDDPRVVVWQSFLQQAIAGLKEEQANAEHSFGQLIQSVS